MKVEIVKDMKDVKPMTYNHLAKHRFVGIEDRVNGRHMYVEIRSQGIRAFVQPPNKVWHSSLLSVPMIKFLKDAHLSTTTLYVFDSYDEMLGWMRGEG